MVKPNNAKLEISAKYFQNMSLTKIEKFTKNLEKCRKIL
jgi:hypothetical protein